MPIPPEQPNNQLCTFDTASDLASRLKDIGISVGTIYEIDTNGDKADTTDERYINSGGLYQFVATIWGGPEQSLAITNAMFEAKGYNWDTFSKLAAAANVTPIDSAIISLHGNIRSVNANLTHQMR